jgi:cation transport ATPase
MTAQWVEPRSPMLNMENKNRPENEVSTTRSCLHCSEPVLYTIQRNQKEHGFCCLGCEQVYFYLKSNDLGDYYSLSQKFQHKIPSQRDLVHTVRNPHLSSALEQYLESLSGNEVQVYIANMVCGACIWIIEQSIKRQSLVSSFDANLEHKLLTIQVKDQADLKSVARQIVSDLKAMGFDPRTPLNSSSIQGISQRDMYAIGVTAVAFANVMIFATSSYLAQVSRETPAILTYMHYWSALLALIALVIGGASIYQRAFASLKLRTIHADLGIALSLSVTMLYSVYNLFFGDQSLLFFDSITGLVFFLAVSRTLSSFVIQQMDRSAFEKMATDVVGSYATFASSEEIITVMPGQLIPCDGTIINPEGAEIVDQHLTGEPASHKLNQGDFVASGSINASETFSLKRLERNSNDWIEKIRKDFRTNDKSSNMESEIVVRFGKIFFWTAITLALFGYSYWFQDSPITATHVALSILIVACPCGIASAVPLMNALTIKSLQSKGILVMNPHILLKLKDIKHIVFDKTGTLTDGTFKVKSTKPIVSSNSDQIAFACLNQGLSSKTFHPVSRAIATWSMQFRRDDVVIHRFEQLPGLGVALVAEANGFEFRVHLGKWAFVNTLWNDYPSLTDAHRLDLGESADQQVASFEKDEASMDSPTSYAYFGYICMSKKSPSLDAPSIGIWGYELEDQIRSDSHVVSTLQNHWGRSVHLLTGDKRHSALSVGQAIGINTQNTHWEKTPAGKSSFVQNLSKDQKTVMMVGDGLNDSGAVLNSNIGVSLGRADASTIKNASIVLMNQNLESLNTLFLYDRSYRKGLALILALTISYNSAAALLALTNQIHPFFAALIMPVASITSLGISVLLIRRLHWKSSTF